MSTFKLGEIVDVATRVEGAKIIEAGSGHILIEHPDHGPVECIDLAAPGVTITRHTPTPAKRP